MADDSVNALIKLIGGKPIRLLLAGPAGVGKSTLAHNIKQRFSVAHIDHDNDMKDWDDFSCPCMLHQFDPYGCFSDAISSKQQFVIDIGAGTVFREDKDNEARLNRMLDFKRDYNLAIVVLTADHKVVREQYLRKGNPPAFKRAWDEWLVAYPWWQKCLDFELPI